MKKHNNYIDLDGCTYYVTYLANSEFEEIEICKIECDGNDFTNILTESDRQRIIKKLS